MTLENELILDQPVIFTLFTTRKIFAATNRNFGLSYSRMKKYWRRSTNAILAVRVKKKGLNVVFYKKRSA